jgi:ribosomal protein L11 methyltransferase
MSNYIRIDIHPSSQEQLDILIAELAEMNFYAFEETGGMLSAFATPQNFREDVVKSYLEQNGLDYSKTLIDHINWNQKWESEFSPVIVENFAGIRASFHPPILNVRHEIIITPKMSFGTGHHATTFLMIQQLSQTDVTNKRVLDFGTGTGILAILAKKTGAREVVAIDNDELCIHNAKENIKINGSDIELINSDNFKGFGTFDIILANINLNTILENLGELKKSTRYQSQIIISGCLEADEHQLITQFSDFGFNCESILLKDGWISIKFKNGER